MSTYLYVHREVTTEICLYPSLDYNSLDNIDKYKPDWLFG